MRTMVRQRKVCVFVFLVLSVVLVLVVSIRFVSQDQPGRFPLSGRTSGVDSYNDRPINEFQAPYQANSLRHYGKDEITSGMHYGKHETAAGAPSRDVLWQEPWPGKQVDSRVPTEVIPTVHYLWCERQKFQFHHYLGILSVVRVLQPTKLVFHYAHLPLTDSYNSWFNELKDSIPYLELSALTPAPLQCKSRDTLNTAIGFLTKKGGYYIGTNVILARAPSLANEKEGSWFAAPPTSDDKTRCIVGARGNVSAARQDTLVQRILSAPKGCVEPESYTDKADCVHLNKAILPRDILDADAPFAELARWLYYGRRARLVVQPDPSNPIPRISHFVKLENNNDFPFAELYRGELTFSHFLSILSALYVGGFQQVYLHTEATPHGRWWDELAGENITILPLDRPHTIYQNKIGVIQHVSDITRYYVLNKYGGAYQDFDVIWSSRIPDWLLAYPTVVSVEWTRSRSTPEFPETFNPGVFMSRSQAPWLRHYLASHKDYHTDDWGYNSILMSYRTYELYPDTVYIDRPLQVICFAKRVHLPVICHPTWDKDYRRDVEDSRPAMAIADWRKEVRAFHMTQPKPHPSMASPAAIGNAKDMYADVARNVLEKSGKSHLLSKS
ncbi:uncharacterized protein [Littorina saxatilis]|uniref:Glycosyltransferase family 32 protein n=1 Tax=Littorina saxatilis TaxID=31220 RepID=A0AAN9AUW0_9CAEN